MRLCSPWAPGPENPLILTHCSELLCHDCPGYQFRLAFLNSYKRDAVKICFPASLCTIPVCDSDSPSLFLLPGAYPSCKVCWQNLCFVCPEISSFCFYSLKTGMHVITKKSLALQWLSCSQIIKVDGITRGKKHVRRCCSLFEILILRFGIFGKVRM